VIENCDIPPIHNGADTIVGRKAFQDFGATRDQAENAESTYKSAKKFQCPNQTRSNYFAVKLILEFQPNHINTSNLWAKLREGDTLFLQIPTQIKAHIL